MLKNKPASWVAHSNAAQLAVYLHVTLSNCQKWEYTKYRLIGKIAQNLRATPDESIFVPREK